jgi:polyisoprenoid-binding protein YceI
MHRFASLRSILAASFLLSCGLGATTTLAADKYKIDPVHSAVIFRAQHAQAGYTYGRFNKFGGTVTADDDATKMAFELSIDVNSIDTGNAKRDSDLKKTDFFSASEFPTITFKSTSVKSAGENKYAVTGDLTMHGQTKPLTITVEKTGQSDTKMFGPRIGYASTFTVKRSDFGMSAMIPMVGDEITLMVAFECVKQ